MGYSPSWDHKELDMNEATNTTTHSSILVWRIPWAIESMGSQRVGHD